MTEEKRMPDAGNAEERKIRLNIGGKEIETVIDENGNIAIPQDVLKIIRAGTEYMEGIGALSKGNNVPAEGKEGSVLKGDSMTDQFKGIPMRELIGAPLFAAAEAQEKLASIALDYYMRIGFYTKDEENIPSGKAVGDTRIITFNLNRPIEENGAISTIQQKVEAPFIGLVPIPALLVDKVDIDFQMEVTDTNTSSSTQSSELNTSISAKWFTVQSNISGKVSSSRENTRTTNQTAKYQIHVSASQQPKTEGLSKLMDIMASCIEPVTVATE